MIKIILFASSYPYSLAKEETFIRPELEETGKKFSVTVIPLRAGGETLGVPDNVVVRTEFADSYRGAGKKILGCLGSVISFHFWQLLMGEIARNPRIIASPAAIKKIIIHLFYAISLARWLKKNIVETAGPEKDQSVYYSFWYDSAATALCLLKKSGLHGRVVTRAHGFDLYEYVQPCGIIPFREMTLGILDKVFFISRNGLEYLRGKYPKHKDKYLYSPMGVADRRVSCGRSEDGVFRIVSCSSIVPGKRVDLIVRAMAAVGRMNGDLKWEWWHIGDGPEIERCRDLSSKELPDNVAVHYLGYLGNSEVFKFYEDNRLDLFTLLSDSEGRPVALMEAISCGLPVVATNVGGVNELVEHGRNGLLMSADPSPADVAEALMSLRSDETRLKRMKVESRAIYDETANAEKNYAAFSQSIEELLGNT